MTVSTLTRDEELLRTYLQYGVPAGTYLSGRYLRATCNVVIHNTGGWNLVTRGPNGCQLLSLDMPIGMQTKGAEVRWRQRAMRAARAVGAPMLPVAINPFYRAVRNSEASLQVVEVNDELESVFTADGRYYLSGYDTQENPPLYFLCRLPYAVDSVAAARESLQPDSVKTALAVGINVVRQGDIFAIESEMTSKRSLLNLGADISVAQQARVGAQTALTAAVTQFPNGRSIYGTAHTAPELARLPNGVMLGKKELRHNPLLIHQNRGADHSPRPLPGNHWWWLTRNTVPVFPAAPRPSITVTNNWGHITGNRITYRIT